MNLSKNFTLEELSRTDLRDMLDKNRELANTPAVKASLTRVANELLEPIRALFKKAINIHSGFRYPELNKAIGGSDNSQHKLGEAADFLIDGYETDEKIVAAILKIAKELPDLKFGQMLSEHGCIHISLGTKKEIAYYDVPTKTKKVFTVK